MKWKEIGEPSSFTKSTKLEWGSILKPIGYKLVTKSWEEVSNLLSKKLKSHFCQVFFHTQMIVPNYYPFRTWKREMWNATCKQLVICFQGMWRDDSQPQPTGLIQAPGVLSSPTSKAKQNFMLLSMRSSKCSNKQRPGRSNACKGVRAMWNESHDTSLDWKRTRV